jgi:hypothetical protein
LAKSEKKQYTKCQMSFLSVKNSSNLQENERRFVKNGSQQNNGTFLAKRAGR